MSRYEEFHVAGWADTELFASSMRGDADPRGTVLISHGYGEHSGRHIKFMEALSRAGWDSISFDHRGHGKSEGLRGLILRMKHMSRDIDTFVNRIRSEATGGPTLLYGHSAGAAAALRYAAEHEEKIDALVLSSVYLKNAEPVSPFLLASARILNMVAPTLPLKPFDPSGISRDPEVVEAYRSDPLVYSGSVRIRTGLELIGSYPLAIAAAPGITIPTLVLHGTADRIADPVAAKEMYDLLGSVNKELKLYDGFYHELHNEPEGEVVIDDIISWLESVFPLKR